MFTCLDYAEGCGVAKRCVHACFGLECEGREISGVTGEGGVASVVLSRVSLSLPLASLSLSLLVFGFTRKKRVLCGPERKHR